MSAAMLTLMFVILTTVDLMRFSRSLKALDEDEKTNVNSTDVS
jgi:hypothetical protein